MEAKEAGRSERPTALMVEKNDDIEQTRRCGTRRRACLVATAIGAILFGVLVLVLALTVFKPRDPRTELVSVSVSGVYPRITFPVLRLELNVTLDVKVLVRNRNYAGFRHGVGTSIVTYRDTPIGEAEISPGTIPARGSSEVPVRLTLEVDELGSELAGLVRDVIAGEISVRTRTTIPGRVVFLGFIKKHAVAVSECQLALGLTEMKVRRQECKSKTKL